MADAADTRPPEATVEPRSRRFTPTPSLRAALLCAFGALCAAVVVALYLGAVRTRTGQRIDEAALASRATVRFAHQTSSGLLDTISLTTLFVSVVLLMVLALGRRRPRLAIGVAIMVVGANVTTQLLKTELLTRPDLFRRPDQPSSTASFPSGHATVAMTIALGVILVVPPRARTFAGALGSAFAVAVGVGTLTAGWHRPSDVIAAYLVVACWAAFVTAGLVLARGSGPMQTRRVRLEQVLSSGRLNTIGTGLMIGAVLISAIVFVVAGDQVLTGPQLGPPYVGAVAAIAGTDLLLLGTFLWLLRGAVLDSPPSEQGTVAPAPLRDHSNVIGTS
jgi:hypothetical protein